MNLRFSRSSLNLIIFACIILIGWASIDNNRSKNTIPELSSELAPVANIALPVLAELQYQTWSSREDVEVFWQTRLDTNFHIRVRSQLHSEQASSNIKDAASLINWQPHYWQWDIDLGTDFEQGLSLLSDQLKKFPNEFKKTGATLILQGPWGNDIAKLTAARIIKSLDLRSLNDDVFPLIRHSPNTVSAKICPWQPVSAQFWLQDQLSNKHSNRPDSQKKHWYLSEWPQLPIITPSSLQVWKQTFIQQWRSNWQNPAMQFDMLADLAYYRLPQNYLLQGYWGINALNVKQLEDYLAQCSAPEQAI